MNAVFRMNTAKRVDYAPYLDRVGAEHYGNVYVVPYFRMRRLIERFKSSLNITLPKRFSADKPS